MFYNNRIGRFSITEELLKEATQANIDRIFEGLIIVECSYCYGSRAFHYKAYSRHFLVASNYEEIPEYVLELKQHVRDGKKYRVTKKWVRK